VIRQLRPIRVALAGLLAPCWLWWLAALLLALASTRPLAPADWTVFGLIFLLLFFPAALLCAARFFRQGTRGGCWRVAQNAAAIHALWYLLVWAACFGLSGLPAAWFFACLPYLLAGIVFNLAVYAFSAWLLLPDNNASKP